MEKKRSMLPPPHRLRKLLRFGMVSGSVIVAAQLAFSTSAFAATCSTGGYAAECENNGGLVSCYDFVGGNLPGVTGGYNGVERYISEPSGQTQLYSSYAHIAFFSEIDENDSGGCSNTGGTCWAQTGIADGYFDGQTLSAWTPYFEQADPYYNSGGAYLATAPSGENPVQNTFFTVYYNGQHAVDGSPLFEAVFYDSAGAYKQIGPSAAMPYNNGYPGSIAEMASAPAYSTTCPVIGGTQYFGTNGAGGVSSGYWLDTANGSGYPNNWQQAAYKAYAPGYNTIPGFPYSVIFLNSGSAFKTSG